MAEAFDPQTFAAQLVPVDGAKGVAALPPDTRAVFLRSPSDELLKALAAHLPHLCHIVTNGNGSSVTDAGLAHLSHLHALETIDLEWSAVSDAGLPLLAALPSLRRVDLDFAARVTPSGITALRAARPDLDVEALGSDPPAG